MSKTSRPLLVFSVFANLLMLVAPLHMMQVYDRVLTSGSRETLFFITLIAAIALVLFGISEAIRMRLAQRQSAAFAVEHAEALFRALTQESSNSTARANALVRDFNTAKMFLASKSHISLYDLPFAPFFLLLLFLIHWQIGLLTLAGIATLVLVAFLNKQAADGDQAKASDANNAAANFASTVIGRSEEINAMGLLPNLVDRWGGMTGSGLIAQEAATKTTAFFHGISRTTRQLLQILIMAWGAWLVLNNDMSGGLIFAASMISSRALQPIEQLIGGWDQLSRARAAFESIDGRLAEADAFIGGIQQPVPSGALRVHDVGLSAGETQLLQGISLDLKPGELLSITGPSGAGKSTLARMIAGAVRPTDGLIALDGCDLKNWPPDQLGRYMGYVAQDAMLFPGSIAENIARMAVQPDEQRVIGAAKMAGVHELINRMPDGYQTRIHTGEFRLSGGQLQRIALARALYTTPRLLVLDEPNAHLDPPGEANLFRVLKTLKENRVTIVLVTQHGALRDLATCSLRIENGRGTFSRLSNAATASPAVATGVTNANRHDPAMQVRSSILVNG